MDALNVLFNLALVVMFGMQGKLQVTVLVCAVGIINFLQLYGYLVVRPYLMQSINGVCAAVSAACMWMTMCVIIATMLDRQVR